MFDNPREKVLSREKENLKTKKFERDISILEISKHYF